MRITATLIIVLLLQFAQIGPLLSDENMDWKTKMKQRREEFKNKWQEKRAQFKETYQTKKQNSLVKFKEKKSEWQKIATEKIAEVKKSIAANKLSGKDNIEELRSWLSKNKETKQEDWQSLTLAERKNLWQKWLKDHNLTEDEVLQKVKENTTSSNVTEAATGQGDVMSQLQELLQKSLNTTGGSLPKF
jgi:hypothetical protein